MHDQPLHVAPLTLAVAVAVDLLGGQGSTAAAKPPTSSLLRHSPSCAEVGWLAAVRLPVALAPAAAAAPVDLLGGQGSTAAAKPPTPSLLRHTPSCAGVGWLAAVRLPSAAALAGDVRDPDLPVVGGGLRDREQAIRHWVPAVLPDLALLDYAQKTSPVELDEKGLGRLIVPHTILRPCPICHHLVVLQADEAGVEQSLAGEALNQREDVDRARDSARRQSWEHPLEDKSL